MDNSNINNENIAYFKKLIIQFVSHKRAQGYKYKSNEESLNRFIKFFYTVCGFFLETFFIDLPFNSIFVFYS